MKLFEIQNAYDNVQELLQICEDRSIDNADIQYALFDNLEVLEPEIEKIKKLIGKRLTQLNQTIWDLANAKRKEFTDANEQSEVKLTGDELENKLKEFNFELGKSLLSEKEKLEHDKLVEKHIIDLQKERDIKLVSFDRALLKEYKLLPKIRFRFTQFMTK
ncbi:MAG: hypothetical protein JZU53_06910 [Paludibacter sp.]|nr:hypothetical protein [Paludibacter sp.]